MKSWDREQPGSGPRGDHVDPGGVGVVSPGVHHAVDVLEARKAAVGDGTEVRRLLPQRTLRTIGAWCFLDHYGPDDVSTGPGMQVPPHPHIGLQTASWLFEGLVLHRDSLGSRQLIRPGELNLMTAGRGIAHSEESAAGRPAVLHGLQLWIALPERTGSPSRGSRITPTCRWCAGRRAGDRGHRRAQGERSPAEVFTPLVGLEVAVPGGDDFVLPVREDFEYGVVAVDGSAVVAGRADRARPARAPARRPVRDPVSPAGGRRLARFFVLGGAPFAERLLMWWNFVGAHRRGDRAGPRRLGGRAVRGSPRLPGEPWRRRRCRAVPLKPR